MPPFAPLADVLVCPVLSLLISVFVQVPRYAGAALVVLCRVALIIAKAVATLGAKWVFATNRAIIQGALLAIGEILRAMRVERVSPISHVAVGVHGVMAMTRAVWTAHATKVDIDCAAWVS